MKAIKGLMMIALVMTIATVGVLVGVNRGWITQKQLQTITRGGAQVIETGQDTKGQLYILSQRSTQVGGEIQKVLGSYVQVNEAEEETPLHERAFEHAQYLYCKQVVTEYERAQP